jgi:DNA polymerase-3 subunit alpha
LANVEKFLNYNKESVRSKENGQVSLFGSLSQESGLQKITLTPSAPADQNEKLIWEKELLGLYVSEHPYNNFRSYLSGYGNYTGKTKRISW